MLRLGPKIPEANAKPSEAGVGRTSQQCQVSATPSAVAINIIHAAGSSSLAIDNDASNLASFEDVRIFGR